MYYFIYIITFACLYNIIRIKITQGETCSFNNKKDYDDAVTGY